ncbi:hypothetical protein B0H11DRAFT_428266 [Mycena galericulata]|nr:hypothetical protein B0H11DRAFT_428266 [Mycena galericulata]
MSPEFPGDERQKRLARVPGVSQKTRGRATTAFPIESIVVSATRASDSWLLPRETNDVMPPVKGGEPLAGLDIFLDTWLLIAYLNGHVYLWNIGGNVPSQCATLDLRASGLRWRSYSASMDPDAKHIILAMSNTSPFETFETVVYKIDIGSTDFSFNLVRSFTYPYPRVIRAIDVDHRLLVLHSSGLALDVVSLDNEERETLKISMRHDTEESYNGVIALRLLGSHFLAILTHTIELHPCAEDTQPESELDNPLKHRLPFPLREGSVSVSDTISSESQDVHTVSILTYDAHSLAFYTVTVTLLTGARPTMDVTLSGEVRPAPPKVHIGGPLTRSHWFVSAHALGPQAIRAMWIERDSLTMTRRVRLCTLNRNAEWHEMETSPSVFTLASYDLRDDLTHCALAELSGRIVMGNRAGAVFLLTPIRTPERIDS